MSEISAGVEALVSRMNTNPEEFFDPKKESEWSFIYSESFRDVMTEPEKAAIHTALKAVRRKEFETKVMKTILKTDAQNDLHLPMSSHPHIFKEDRSATGWHTANNLMLGNTSVTEEMAKTLEELHNAKRTNAFK